MKSSSPPRVLALCLSEAPWSCLRDPSFADQVPFLTRLATQGARGTTLGSQPLVNEALWATLVTGRSAGAHGVFASVRREGHGSFRPLAPKDLAVPPIWRLVEDAGMPTGTFNVGHADPTQPTKGFTVTRDARLAIHPDLVQPPEIYQGLVERFGQWTTTTKARTRSDWMSLAPREAEVRAEVLSDLLRTRPWNFALAHLVDVARVQHRFWSEGVDTLRAAYGAADRAIEKMVEAAGPRTVVFVFSECGSGPIRHGVHVNTWLEQQGYLRRRNGPAQRLGRALARLHQRVRGLLPRALDLSRVKMRIRASISASNIDWSRTRAFCPRDSNEILFNVPADERRALADELCARLREWRDPEGRPAVEEVIRREAWGSRGESAPDLTLVWEDDAYMPIENFDGSDEVFVDWRPVQSDFTFTGSHRREGILMVSGPGIEPTDLGQARLVDLVPTWLELLGVDIPPDLEGTSFAGRLSGPAPAAEPAVAPAGRSPCAP